MVAAMQPPRSPVARAILEDASDPLRRMDIFLTRNRGSLVNRLISWSTRCYWSHAAVTFLIPHPDMGFQNAFVMESSGPGVDVQKASKYFDHADLYDFAIVRFNPPWFDEEICRDARGRLIENIDAQYDRGRILAIAYHLLFRRPMHAAGLVRDRYRKRNRPHKRWIAPPNEYICSGFVSYAFYEAAWRLDEKDGGARWKEALFHPAFAAVDPDSVSDDAIDQLVLSTSPADIARSDRVDWKWVVLGGEAHRVSSRREADEWVRRVRGREML
jgi:hypothetical protein